ncbi:MAG: DUF4258 domain-containing protein [Selenomonadaceae bacterium]|nr:DUF4258 domain-containing protein [Selenomonadaceae bacterium]
MVERQISTEEVLSAIMSGEVIKEYPDDSPYPSCLVCGNNGIHVVCALAPHSAWLITTYRPDPAEWEPS